MPDWRTVNDLDDLGSLPTTAVFMMLQGAEGAETAFKADYDDIKTDIIGGVTGVEVHIVGDAATLVAIASPGKGDLAFQSDKSLWHVYSGTTWLELGTTRRVLPDVGNATDLTNLAAEANDGDVVFRTDNTSWYIYETGNGWRVLDASAAATASYTATFVIADFTGGVLTIAGATHGMGTHPVPFIVDSAGDEQGVATNVDTATGDITLSVVPGFEFDGEITVAA